MQAGSASTPMSDTAGPTVTTSDGGARLSAEWEIDFGGTVRLVVPAAAIKLTEYIS